MKVRLGMTARGCFLGSRLATTHDEKLQGYNQLRDTLGLSTRPRSGRVAFPSYAPGGCCWVFLSVEKYCIHRRLGRRVGCI
jgi:hypothetical protein